MRRFVKESKKKAFTLVELLVVIAILAILASVSVVGYLGFTEKANKSVDEQLCAQYNTLLKAQSALDDDITLPELITLIEENGINSNQFRTLSKGYTFAYYPDPTNGQCVLLDKDSGQVLFPENAKSVTADKLWAVYPKNQKLQKGVNNYALLSSVVYNPTQVENVTYNFDLNKNSIVLPETVSNNLNLANGTAVYKGAKPANVTPGTGVDVIKTGDENFGGIFVEGDTFDSNVLKKGVKSDNDKTLTLDGLKFFSGVEEYDGNICQATLTDTETAAYDKLVVKNCDFTGLRLTINANTNLEVVVENCDFNNTNSYALHCDTVKDLTIKNCTLVNCNRGMNIGFAVGKTTITGNTYNLAHIETQNKGENKDNAIQFFYDNPGNYIENIGTETAAFKAGFNVLVNNNTVEKANGFITMHGGFATRVGPEAEGETKMNYIESFRDLMKAEVAKSADARLFKFEGNKHSGIAKLAKDPGVTEVTKYSDYYNKDGTPKPFEGQKADRTTVYNDTCSAMESLID